MWEKKICNRNIGNNLFVICVWRLFDLSFFVSIWSVVCLWCIFNEYVFMRERVIVIVW